MTVEWVGGTDDAEELPGPPRRPPGRRRLWWLAGALAFTAATAVVLSQSDTGSHPAAHDSAPVASPSTTLPPVIAELPAPSTPDSQPSVLQLGHPLIAGGSRWELFARSSDSVVRIEMASGRITTTPLPTVLSEGGVAFVAGPTAAIVRPNDAVPGYLVPDGRAARPLSGLFAAATDIFPGPARDEIWVQGGSDNIGTPPPVLYDWRTNTVTGTRLAVPAQLGGPLTSDGSGYLLYSGVGGIYDVRATGVHRVTTGTIVAVGSTSWLTLECDDTFQCGTVLVDQRTGNRVRIGTSPIQPDYLPGLISPDGKYAVYVADIGGSTESLRIVDLANATDRGLSVHPANVTFGTQPFAWAPTGHMLFIADNNETLELVDPGTLSARVLDPRVPHVIQLTVRTLP